MPNNKQVLEAISEVLEQKVSAKEKLNLIEDLVVNYFENDAVAEKRSVEARKKARRQFFRGFLIGSTPR